MAAAIRKAIAVLMAVSVAALLLVSAPASAGAPAAERVIVAFAPGTTPSAQNAVLASVGIGASSTVHRLPQVDQAVVLATPAQRFLLEQKSSIEAVVTDVVVELAYTPDDPEVAGMQGLDDIGVEAAWDTYPGAGGFSPTGPFTGAPIAVIDSGVDPHQEFAGPGGDLFDDKVPVCVHYPPNILFDPVDCTNGSADDISHGTHVAGTAAAIADDGLGIPGISPTSPIYSYKACQQRLCWLGDLEAGLIDATDDGAKVINLSVGGVVALSVWQDAIHYAIDNDVVVVAAAGNFGNTLYSYPASFNGVLSVAATDTGADTRASFSQYNDKVRIAAPGTGIISSVAPEAAGGQPNAYAVYSGTSMATPHVAGAAALIRSAHPDWTAGQVVGAILNTADDIGTPGIDNEFGYGRIDVAAAINHVPAPDGDLDDDGFADAIDGDAYNPLRFDVTAASVSTSVSGVTVTIGSFLGIGIAVVSAPDRLAIGFLSMKQAATSLGMANLSGTALQIGPGLFQAVPIGIAMPDGGGTASVSLGGTSPLDVTGPTSGGTVSFTIT